MEGLALAVAASFLWSLNPAIISKFKCPSMPLVFAGLRSLIAFLILLPLTNFNLLVLNPYALVIVAVSAITDLGVGIATYAKAVEYLGGGLATVIAYTNIFITQAIAFAFLGEGLTPSLLIGTVVAFVGVVIALGIGSKSGLSLRGVGYGAVTAVGWGVGVALIKPALTYLGDSILVTSLRLLVTALTFLPLGLASEARFSERGLIKNVFIASALTGFLSLSLGVLIFTQAVYIAGVSTSVVATALTPVLSQITVKLLGKEPVSRRVVLGALIVSVGVLVLLT